jgi:hypothetical protein
MFCKYRELRGAAFRHFFPACRSLNFPFCVAVFALYGRKNRNTK